MKKTTSLKEWATKSSLGSGKVISHKLLNGKERNHSGEVIFFDEQWIVLRGPFLYSDQLLESDEGEPLCQLQNGDLFIEFYPLKKNYTVLFIGNSDMSFLKGIYMDVCSPIQVFKDEKSSSFKIEFTDYALDVWASSDLKTVYVLDEKEFLQLKLDEGERDHCRATVQFLKGLIESRDFPIACSTCGGGSDVKEAVAFSPLNC